MKGYLIDPYKQTIEEVDYDGNYRSIYGLLTAEGCPVGTFDTVRINDKQDVIFVDDEGLFKRDQKFFKHPGYPTPLAGKGLVLGGDTYGNTRGVSKAITLEGLRADVKWLGSL